jgi:large subunit ribosomal protein L11
MAKKKKELVGVVKLQITAGQATPAPPVGPALGQHGVNIGQFVQQFNEASKSQLGTTVPVKINIYKDKSFDFQLFSPPASVLIKKALGLAKGAAAPNRETVGEITRAQLQEIAKAKKDVLKAGSIEAAARMIEGTARSMGVKVKD